MCESEPVRLMNKWPVNLAFIYFVTKMVLMVLCTVALRGLAQTVYLKMILRNLDLL